MVLTGFVAGYVFVNSGRATASLAWIMDRQPSIQDAPGYQTRSPDEALKTYRLPNGLAEANSLEDDQEGSRAMLASNPMPAPAAARIDKTNKRSSQAARSIRLIEPELPYLRRYARALTRDVDQADDLVHDCVARAIANIDKWDPGTQLRPWLIVMTRNLFYNRCRRAKREREAMTEIGLSGEHSTAPTQETNVEFRDVAEAFAELSDDHREVLALVVIEGMDYETAAQTLNICEGTVKSRLSRARQALKAKVDRP